MRPALQQMMNHVYPGCLGSLQAFMSQGLDSVSGQGALSLQQPLGGN